MKVFSRDIINLARGMHYYDTTSFTEIKVLLIYHFEMHRHINVSCAKKELEAKYMEEGT